MKKLVVLALATLAITSCVHSPFHGEEEYYFQAMGADSEIVVTVDAERAKVNETIGIEENTVTKRAERVSVALDPRTVEKKDYPLSFDQYSFYGAIEGNYGKGITNMGLGMAGFEKVKVDGRKFYEGNGIQLGVPRSGLVVFSSDDYLDAVERTVEDRKIMIPHALASEMSSSLASFYVRNPQTMLDLGFDLPITVLLKMDNAVIFINEDGFGFTLNARIEMQDERNARTLNTVLRNNIVADLRRKGEKPDFKELSKLLYQEGRIVYIYDKPITAEEAQVYLDKANGMFGGII